MKSSANLIVPHLRDVSFSVQTDHYGYSFCGNLKVEYRTKVVSRDRCPSLITVRFCPGCKREIQNFQPKVTRYMVSLPAILSCSTSLKTCNHLGSTLAAILIQVKSWAETSIKFGLKIISLVCTQAHQRSGRVCRQSALSASDFPSRMMRKYYTTTFAMSYTSSALRCPQTFLCHLGESTC